MNTANNTQKLERWHLSEESRWSFVEESNTEGDFSKNLYIHQLFEMRVEQTPDKVAVVCENDQITYRQLNSYSNQLAQYLQTLSVGPEVLVGICIERSLLMVIGILGILKAGGAYVPLDPTYPKDRLNFILADTGVPIVLTQQHLIEKNDQCQTASVYLDVEWGTITKELQENVTNDVMAGNAAYVIYTSGSTGKPKGVVITHQNLVSSTYARFSYYSEPVAAFLLLSSFAFDSSIAGIFWTLCQGGTLILPAQDAERSLAKYKELIGQYHISHLLTLPSLYSLFLDHARPHELSSLRTVIVAGESCAKTLVERHIRLLPGVLCFNEYGPTETTVWSSVYDCRAESLETSVPIGWPIKNTELYILDLHLQSVPAGMPGEIYIGGAGLARGYLHSPDLTAEKFIPNMYASEPGCRMYKTGDLARYLGRGCIEFLGRKDHQIKVRGFRVELGEIEMVLRQHPDLQEAVVLANKDEIRGTYLAAYYVPVQKNMLPTFHTLRNFLMEKLPDYMIPAIFIEQESLPRTPNGKIDRNKLQVPDLAYSVNTRPFVAPKTATEEVLAAIWANILGFEQVSRDDNFFELAGNSLTAMRIISRIRETFNIELPLRSLFESPTVACLAKIIEEDRDSLTQRGPAIRPVPRLASIPLSFPQERIWFIQQLDPTNIAYTARVILQIAGPFDVAVFKRSLDELVRRHEILRTTFPTVDDLPVQLIHAPLPASLSIIDLHDLPESKRRTEANRKIDEELRKPFDLTKLPLSRWTLVRLAVQEHIVILVEHHLVHDGWSANVLLGELLQLYKAFASGKPSPLTDLPIQFADFVYWQRQWMQGEVVEKQLAYWRVKLADCSPALKLPFDRPRPEQQRFRGAAPRVELPLPLCRKLRALSHQEGVTLFITLFSAFLVLLHHYSEQEDICVGSGFANRRWQETEGLVGMIINTIVLRTDLSGNPTFRELLKRVREVILDASMYQDLPLDQVVAALQPERSLTKNPLFQVMFSIHDAPLPYLELPNMSLHLLEAPSNGSAKFDLNIVVIPRAEQQGWHPGLGTEGITLVWEYNIDLFEASTITQMLGHFQAVLENAVGNPEKHLSALSFFSNSLTLEQEEIDEIFL